MIVVNSKSEIKEALQMGETELYTSNQNLLYASALVGKFKSRSSLPSVGDCCEVATGTVIITMMVLATAIALFAIYNGYDVEVDLKNGTIKCRKKR